MDFNGLKDQIAGPIQLQRALHNPSQGIRDFSSKTIGPLKNKKLIYILFNHLALALRCASVMLSTLSNHAVKVTGG